MTEKYGTELRHSLLVMVPSLNFVIFDESLEA